MRQPIFGELQLYVLNEAYKKHTAANRAPNTVYVGAFDISFADAVAFYGESSPSTKAATSRSLHQLIKRGFLAHAVNYRLQPIRGRFVITPKAVQALAARH